MTIIGRPVYSDELLHYQVKGAKWGTRRWQYPDGSLTPEGRTHYGIGPARDKDPDMVDPGKTASEDIQYLINRAGVNKAHGVAAAAMEKELKKGRKWLRFESKEAWEKRKATLEGNLKTTRELEEEGHKDYERKWNEAQARFEKYMQFSDEILSDVNWIDFNMYLETGEAGSKQTYKDRDEMEHRWFVLEEAVNVYWYSGLMNRDRSRNANDNYREKFEMNDSPRGKEAAREQTAKFALRNVNGRKSKDLSSAVINAKDTSDIRKFSEFKNIDTSELSKSIRARQDHSLSSDNKKVIDKIADSLLGDHGNQEFTTSWGQKMRVKDAVSSYIEEKAYAESTEDIGDLTSMWESYSFYDVTDKLNRELKKQHTS